MNSSEPAGLQINLFTYLKERDIGSMAKKIPEKVPGWIERILLPHLDGRIRAEIDRAMEFEKKLSDIDKRLAVIERNPLITVFNDWSVKRASEYLNEFEKKIKGNPLAPWEIDRRRELTARLESGAITPEEARELQGILNRELEEARERNDFLAALAILFLLGLVLALISRR